MKNTITAAGHTFEIVNEFPLGYEIWNIGHNMIPGYLPLCRPISPGSYSIEPDTLKAIPLEGAQVVLAAIGHGQNTVVKMEQYLERYRCADPGTVAHRQVERIKAALPILKTVKGA